MGLLLSLRDAGRRCCMQTVLVCPAARDECVSGAVLRHESCAHVGALMVDAKRNTLHRCAPCSVSVAC